MAHSAYTDVRVITATFVLTTGSLTIPFSSFTNLLATGKPVSPSQNGVYWCRNVTPPPGGGNFTGLVTNAGGESHDDIAGTLNGARQSFSDQMVWQDETSYTITGPNGSYKVVLWLI